jgi:hypothetical protein
MSYIFVQMAFLVFHEFDADGYDLYQRVALGGFSTPRVGSTQRRGLPHTTDL